jgi:hypothetical protein
MTQEQNSSSLKRKAHPFHIQKSEASQVEHEEHIDDLFESDGIAHQELVSLGLMVNQHYYWEDLPQLREQVC